ncbi:MAG: ABC transporter permease [Pseudobdellovibrionaceae bacterium]
MNIGATALHSSSLQTAIANTVFVSASVAFLCVAVSLLFAFLLVRTDLPWTKTLTNLLTLPYVVPPFIGAIGWIILANPASGIINQFAGYQLVNIYTYFGIIFVEFSFLFILSLLPLMSAFQKIDPSLEEAARLSGCRPSQVFWYISIPLLKKHFVGHFILIFMSVAASFGVPALLGGPARVFFLTTQIYTLQKMGTMNGLYQALFLSCLMLIGVVVLYFGQHYFLNSRDFHTIVGKSNRPTLFHLKKWKWPTFGFILLFWICVFVMPVLGLIISAFSKIPGTLAWDNLSLIQFQTVLFETEETKRALKNSFLLAFSTATSAVGISFFLALSAKKILPERFKKFLETAISIPYAMPGSVVALCMIAAFSRGFYGVGPSLYNTLFIIFIAYNIKYLSLAYGTTQSALNSLHPSLSEAASLSGANSWNKIKFILFPLMKSALFAAWLLVFIPCLSELTMTQLLTGPGRETIGTLIFQLQEYSDMGGGGPAALSLLLIFILFVLQNVVRFLSQYSNMTGANR